jgi:hypothetical protein
MISRHRSGILLSSEAFLIFLSILCCPDLFSQNITTDYIEQVAEKLSETTKDADLSDQAADLEHLKNHPLNLNHASFEEMLQLPFLNEIQVNNLYLYTRTYGTIYSPSELFAVDGFDTATVLKILPFVGVGKPPPKHTIRFKDLFSSGRSDFIILYKQILQKQKGYSVSDSALMINPDAGYLGSPQRYSFRYTYKFFDRISLGISGEKDAGEEFFKGSQKGGMDYYGGYVCLMNTGILKSLIIGNFRAGVGQGLVLGTGYSLSSDPNSGRLGCPATGVKPCLSTSETGHLSGIAATVKLRSFDLSAFYSYQRKDANPAETDSLSGETTMITSIGGSGYHRLPKEIANENIIRENIFGGNLNWRNNILSIGITGFHSNWSALLKPKFYTYNKFSFRGKENLNIGADFRLSLKNIYAFGEIGRSMNSSYAWLAGGQFSPDPDLAFSILYRDYQRDYQDLLCNSFGQNSTNANERGFLFTFYLKMFSKFSFSGYADLFQFPWLKYQVDFASHGSEFQLQCDYAAAKNLLMNLRCRFRTKEVNIPGSTEALSMLEESRCLDIRFQADWSIGNETALRTRIEFLENKKEIDYHHYGYLLSQGISYKPLSKRISVSLLYALFDTDTYNERIYAYENDVLYGYSVPSYYGKGIHFAALAEWIPVRWLTVWVKCGHTMYTDRNRIGTGLEEIEGNKKTEVTVEMRLRFQSMKNEKFSTDN